MGSVEAFMMCIVMGFLGALSSLQSSLSCQVLTKMY